MTNWLLYGAYGYTGKLIVEEAVGRGHRPVLAGRDAARVEALAQTYDLEWLAFDLDYPERLTQVAERFDLVLHAAGPFVNTSQPMLDACLAGQAHYLDITGELSVFENTFAHHTAALDRNILLMSGVGFDIVPSDCLARYVAEKMPGATWLETAISTPLDVSAGTVKSALSGMTGGQSAIVVRRDDELIPIPFGSGSRTVFFSNGREVTMTPAPWGDLVTAAHSTGIGNITSYLELPSMPGGDLATKLGGRLLSFGPVRRAAERAIERGLPRPRRTNPPDVSRLSMGQGRQWTGRGRRGVAGNGGGLSLHGHCGSTLGGADAGRITRRRTNAGLGVRRGLCHGAGRHETVRPAAAAQVGSLRERPSLEADPSASLRL